MKIAWVALDLEGKHIFFPNKETDDLTGKWDTYGIVFTLEWARLPIKPLDLSSFSPPFSIRGKSPSNEKRMSLLHLVPFPIPLP